jgi:hypothetical protein
MARDKSTGHISVQLYKSEAAGGKSKAKDLLAEELTFREHDDVHYTGVLLSTRFITTVTGLCARCCQSIASSNAAHATRSRGPNGPRFGAA